METGMHPAEQGRAGRLARSGTMTSEEGDTAGLLKKPRPGTVAVVGAGLAGVATVRNPAPPFPPPSPRHLGPLLLLRRSRPFQLGDERTSPSGGWRAGTPSPRRD